MQTADDLRAFHPSRLILLCLWLLLGANCLEHGLLQIKCWGRGEPRMIFLFGKVFYHWPPPTTPELLPFSFPLNHYIRFLWSSRYLVKPAERFIHTAVIWGGLVRKRDIFVDGPDTLEAARWAFHKQLKTFTGVSFQWNFLIQKHKCPP